MPPREPDADRAPSAAAHAAAAPPARHLPRAYALAAALVTAACGRTVGQQAPAGLSEQLRAACTPGALGRVNVGPAVVLVAAPRSADLVAVSPERPQLADALAAAVADTPSFAFNVQFQTTSSNFEQTRGATLQGDLPLHPLPPDDLTRSKPDAFATFEALEPAQLRLVPGSPAPTVPGRRFAMGGLIAARAGGRTVESWYVTGQEEGHAFVAQAKGKLMLALGSPSGCVAVLAHPNVDLDGFTASANQADADARALLTFSGWTRVFADAGYADVLIFDSGISPHLVVHGEQGLEVLVPMDPSARAILRYGARIGW
jgi:hypothetical protein